MGVEPGLSHYGINHRLWVLKNRVLREIFGPKKDEIIRRKMNNEELRNIITKVRLDGMKWTEYVCVRE
jgi:hypothetical protein